MIVLPLKKNYEKINHKVLMKADMENKALTKAICKIWHKQ